jgi:MFS family permease
VADPALEPAAAPPAASSSGLDRGYPWFAAGVASWFGAWGVQQVTFTWLVVGELGASAEWVGVVQTSPMLPALVLLPLGGAVADRLDPRRLLVALHVVAALPALGLASAVAAGRLGFGDLLLYGLCMGAVMAFSIPARDSLLSRVAGANLMRAVTGTTIAQFGAQGAGTLVAGAARWTGAPAMLLVQAAILLLGGLSTRRLPRAKARDGPPRPAPRPRELTEGLRFVLASPLRGILLLLCGVGILFMGPFVVVFPLLVRDHYAGGVGQLAQVLMLFPLGTITGSLALLARGGIERKGRALLLALGFGGAMLIVIGHGLPFAGFLAATLAWGVAGAVFMNSSRTLFQQAAPAERLARVMAVYQVCLMGAGPLGTLLAGVVAARIGAHATCVAFGAAMLALVSGVALASGVARLR